MTNLSAKLFLLKAFGLGLLTMAFWIIGCTPSSQNDPKQALDLNDITTALEMRHWFLEMPLDVRDDDLVVLVTENFDGTRHIWAEPSFPDPGEKLRLMLWKPCPGGDYSYLLTGSGQHSARITTRFHATASTFIEHGEVVPAGTYFMKGSSSEGPIIRVSSDMTALEEGEHGMRLDVIRGFWGNEDR